MERGCRSQRGTSEEAARSISVLEPRGLSGNRAPAERDRLDRGCNADTRYRAILRDPYEGRPGLLSAQQGVCGRTGGPECQGEALTSYAAQATSHLLKLEISSKRFLNIIATATGPTPPGTGVKTEATSAQAGSASPNIFLFSSLVPASMRATPFSSVRALRILGFRRPEQRYRPL